MAHRTPKTRPKTTGRATFRIAVPKPRNPLVAPAIKRVAGPHGKTRGARRLAERQALLRKLTQDDDA